MPHLERFLDGDPAHAAPKRLNRFDRLVDFRLSWPPIGHKTRDRAAVTRDDDRVSAFNIVE